MNSCNQRNGAATRGTQHRFPFQADPGNPLNVPRTNPPALRPVRRRAFSLIELVIVVVIIAIIAAIAVPRMARSGQVLAQTALARDLSVMRKAIDLYQAEHQALPASAPGATAADLVRQLTRYTDAAGLSNAGATKDASHPYGPYFRRMPPLPVGSKRRLTTVRVRVEGDTPGLGPEAWVYFPATGDIRVNLSDAEVDPRNVPYNQY